MDLTKYTYFAKKPCLLTIVAIVHMCVDQEYRHDRHTETKLPIHTLGSSSPQSRARISWLPKEMCDMLQLPLSLMEWMVPMGTCSRKCCKKVYYEHRYGNRVSLSFYNHRLEGSFKGSKVEPSDLAIYVCFCSYFCQQQFFL